LYSFSIFESAGNKKGSDDDESEGSQKGKGSTDADVDPGLEGQLLIHDDDDRSIEDAIWYTASPLKIVHEGIEESLKNGFQFGYRGMEKTEAYTNKILKSTGIIAKYGGKSIEGYSVMINLAVAIAKPSPTTIGRAITDIICIPLNDIPYIGVGLSIGLTLYNNNGYLDGFYNSLATPKAAEIMGRPYPMLGW
jgi:hypothetical protein